MILWYPLESRMSDPQNPELQAKHVPDEPPPFLGTWPRVYGAVLCYLVTLIILFALFSRAFTPAL